MDWICPTFNTVLGDQIRKYYGKITPEIARQYISAVEMSGDNLLSWYDLTNGIMWVSRIFNFGCSLCFDDEDDMLCVLFVWLVCDT
jgi:hypothetical protein